MDLRPERAVSFGRQGRMHFLKDSSWSLFFRKKPSSAPIKERLVLAHETSLPAKSLPSVFESEDGKLRLALKQKEGRIVPQLLHPAGSAIYLERLKLSLYSPYGKGQPISLHPEIAEDMRFQIFKQGFLGASISNKKQAHDRNSWHYHESSIGKNPEQVKWESESPNRFGRFWLLPRGYIHSDHFVYLEEVLPSLPHEWGEEDDTPTHYPLRFLASASHSGQQLVRFFVRLHPRTGQLIEFHAIWDFGGRLLPTKGRLSLTSLSWHFENLKQPTGSAEMEREARTTCSHVLLKHHEHIAKNFHCKAVKPRLLRFWSPFWKDVETSDRLLQNLELARNAKLRLSHFVWPHELLLWEDAHTSYRTRAELNLAIERLGIAPIARFSPFLMNRDDPVADRYADLILPGSRPIKRSSSLLYPLDPTHPDYRAWLKETIQRILKEDRFGGLLLEDLYLPAYRALYKNPQTSAGGRLREALLLIRKFAGRSNLLVGKDCPFWPAIGLLDAMQVSGDFGQSWQSTRLHRLIGGRDIPAVRKALISVINHSGMHRNYWKNAPGPAHICHDKLSSRKQRLLSAVLTLSGGALQIADVFQTLRPDQLSFLSEILAINAECQRHTPVSLHVCESSFPRGFWNPAGYLGIWNPTEHAERIELPIPLGLARNQLKNRFNLWGVHHERVAWRLEQDRFSIALGPFDTIVVKIG